MLINELFREDQDIAPEEAPLSILNSKYILCMDKNGKYTKYTRHNARRVNYVRNGGKYKMH